MSSTNRGLRREPPVTIFLSYASEDHAVAKDLQRRLETASSQLKVWEYAGHSGYGKDIWNENIGPAIHQCDVFAIIVSKYSLRSPNVAREIELARKLAKGTYGLRPVILGLLTHSAGARKFSLRDFHSGHLRDDTFDLSPFRCFDLTRDGPDDLAVLARTLQSRIRFFGARSARGAPTESPEEIPDHAFRCLEQLFPTRDEQNPADEILEWLSASFDEVDQAVPHSIEEENDSFSSRWGELLATMEIGGQTVGVAHLSIQKRSGWVFGNYFGVLSKWRRFERARWFYEQIIPKVRHIAPIFKGFVFEVRSIDIDQLISAASKLTPGLMGARRASKPRALTAREEMSAASYLRMNMFGTSGAVAPVTRTREFLPYRQPALSDPPKREAEVDSNILLQFMDGQARAQIDSKELYSFLFDEVYFDSRVRMPSTAIGGYELYLRALKEELERDLEDRNGGALVSLVNPEQLVGELFSKRAKQLRLVKPRLSSIIANRKKLKRPF